MNQAALAVSVAASLGAAAIHFALGPSHVQELGPLGLGFYLAAILQVVLPVTLFLTRNRERRAFRSVVLAGVAVNLAILAAWAVSRVVGLPAGAQPWTPEAIGVADSVSAALGLVVVTMGAILLRRAPSWIGRPPKSRWAQSLALGPAIALIAVATSFALLSPQGVAGHGADDHAHAPADAHTPTDVRAPGPHLDPTDAPAVRDQTTAHPEPSVEVERPAEKPDVGGEANAGHGHADGEKSQPHGH